MSTPTAAASGPTHLSNGGRLVAADGRTLPLKAVTLAADARGGVARAKLTQAFHNPHPEPLKVTYQVPLPADAAVSGFCFLIGETRVVGEVDGRQRARRRFEEALLEGRTAAILDQERTSLFTQEVGNIPPGVEVSCELELDLRLAWLPEGAWELRFPTVVAPRYQGAAGRVRDAAKLGVDVADAPLSVRAQLALSIRDALPQGARPESPSHPLFSQAGNQRFDVTFGGEAGAALDRDIVVRWPVAQLQVGASVDAARPRAGAHAEAAYGLLTLVPPSPAAGLAAVPRDVIVLLDTSGSMAGAPLDHARRVVSALIDTLGPSDKLELIEFSSAPRRWKWRPQEANEGTRKAAKAWLAGLRASGGTEMKDGILEALEPLRPDAQRQVVLVTDGLIGFEDEVLEAISEKLPPSSRVHTVGVGSGVNRSLTRPAARVGRGVELVVGLDEDVERVAQRLCARTALPFVTQVEVTGSAVLAVAPQRVPDLFAGAPCLVSLKLKAGGGTIVVRGKTAHGGAYEERLEVKPVERGEGSAAICTLFGREQVEDLETSGLHRSDVDAQVEALGLAFQVSTRLTSWVAVAREASVDPRAPRRNEVMPHQLPYGMSAEGLGLRAAQPAYAAAAPVGATRAGTLKDFGLGAGGLAPPSPRAAERTSAAPPPPAGAKGGPFFEEAGRSEEGYAAEELPADEESADLSEAGDLGARSAEPAPMEPEPVAAPKRAEKAEGARSAPAPMRPSRSPAFRATPSRRLAARVVLFEDGKLYLEVLVEGLPLDWRPRAAAVTSTGKATGPAAIIAERTTLPCTATAGMALTLALDVGALGEVPAEVTVTMDGEVLTLAVG